MIEMAPDRVWLLTSITVRSSRTMMTRIQVTGSLSLIAGKATSSCQYCNDTAALPDIADLTGDGRSSGTDYIEEPNSVSSLALTELCFAARYQSANWHAPWVREYRLLHATAPWGERRNFPLRRIEAERTAHPSLNEIYHYTICRVSNARGLHASLRELNLVHNY